MKRKSQHKRGHRSSEATDNRINRSACGKTRVPAVLEAAKDQFYRKRVTLKSHEQVLEETPVSGAARSSGRGRSRQKVFKRTRSQRSKSRQGSNKSASSRVNFRQVTLTSRASQNRQASSRRADSRDRIVDSPSSGASACTAVRGPVPKKCKPAVARTTSVVETPVYLTGVKNFVPRTPKSLPWDTSVKSEPSEEGTAASGSKNYRSSAARPQRRFD